MLGLIFSSKLDWGSYITSIAKTAMKFLFREVALNLPYSHVWNTVVMSRLVPLVATWYFLDILQKQIWRTIGPLLAASLEPLAHRQNVTSLSLFYRYYFGRCSSELAQLVPLPFSGGRSTRYSDRSCDLSATIPRCMLQGFLCQQFLSWHS